MMVYQFANTDYPTLEAMLDAVALDWVTASGQLVIEDAEAREWLAQAAADPDALAAEVIKEDRLYSMDGPQGYSQADLAAAFKRLAERCAQ
jgi:hypothetical protein